MTALQRRRWTRAIRYLLRNREELLKEIRRSKEFFQKMAR